jgi:hypothetical protein
MIILADFGGNYPGCYNDSYYQQLFRPEAPNPGALTIENYAPGVLGGAEPFQFLKDTFRFRGDFLSAIDARSYVDFLREDWDACCTPSYPVGGMSSYIYAMLAKGKKFRGRAFSSEPVRNISRSEGRYLIETSKRQVLADKVVIAVPPSGLQNIGGSIANDIKASAQYNSIKGIPVVTIENWWKSPGWWTALRGDTTNTIDRAWATPERGFSYNFVEMAHSKYQRMQINTVSLQRRSTHHHGLDCCVSDRRRERDQYNGRKSI